MRNFLFCSIVSIAILAPVATIALSDFGVTFPEWTMIGQEKSFLETRTYQQWEGPEWDNLDGQFQNKFEKYLADHVPMRDNALILDASIERSMISLAASVAEYDVYHSFYDSQYVIDVRHELILQESMELPAQDSSYEKARKRWIAALNTAAEAHPETNFVFDIVLEPQQDSSNPTYQLMRGNKLVDEQWAQKNIADSLSAKIDAFVDPIGGIDNLQTGYHKNDNHWTLERALESYRHVANKLDLEPFSWTKGSEEKICDWYGAAAKGGRYFGIQSILSDNPTDFSTLNFQLLGKSKSFTSADTGRREGYYKGKTTMEDTVDSAYNVFYGARTNMIIDNDSSSAEKTCLLIGDSYSRCLYRYIASNYSRTIYVLPGNNKTDSSLLSLLDTYNPNDVIIIANCMKHRSIESTSPNFMKLQNE